MLLLLCCLSPLVSLAFPSFRLLIWIAFGLFLGCLLSFADLCWVLLGSAELSYCGGRAERASEASERSSLVLSVGFLGLPMHSLAYPCFLLLRFSACYLAFSFEWYPGTPSLTLPSVPGCSLPSYGFSCFTLCQRFLKKIALPVPC